jgi:hypothetical protein
MVYMEGEARDRNSSKENLESLNKSQMYQLIECEDFKDISSGELPHSPREAAVIWLARIAGRDENTWKLGAFSNEPRRIKRAFVAGISDDEFMGEPVFARALRTQVLEKLPGEQIIDRIIENTSDRPELSEQNLREEIRYREASLAAILYLINSAKGEGKIQDKIVSFLESLYRKESEDLSLLRKDCDLSRGLGTLGRDLAWVYNSCGASYFKSALSGLSNYSPQVRQAIGFLERGETVLGDPFYWAGNLVREAELGVIADRISADEEESGGTETASASIKAEHLADRYLLSRIRGIIGKEERLGREMREYSDYDIRGLKTEAAVLTGRALYKKNPELVVDILESILENEGYFGKYLDNSGERNILEEDPLNLFSSCFAAIKIILDNPNLRRKSIRQAERLLGILSSLTDKFEDAFLVETPSRFVIDLLATLEDNYSNLSVNREEAGGIILTADVAVNILSAYFNSWFKPQNRDELEKIFSAEEAESRYPQFKNSSDIVEVIAQVAEGINKKNLPEFVRNLYIEFYRQVVSYLSEIMRPAERITRDGFEVISLREQIGYYDKLPVPIHMAIFIDRVEAHLRRIISPTRKDLFRVSKKTKEQESAVLTSDNEFATAIKVMTLIKTKLLKPEDSEHMQLASDYFHTQAMMVQPRRVAGEADLLRTRTLTEASEAVKNLSALPKEYTKLLGQLTQALDNSDLTEKQRKRIIALFEESWHSVNEKVRRS